VEVNIQDIIFNFLGGLGIFLFGIKYMGDGLQTAAGDRLRSILDRFTTNPLMGVLAGAFITAIIQSSSGTTSLTVALVSAGYMTLRQAIGVIMGANIGTTMTAFIIGFDIGEYSLPIIATGAFMLFFFKRKSVTVAGRVVFGLGALFFGLELMSAGMKPLSSLDAFYRLTMDMSHNPLLGVLVGTTMTIIIQSSSATIGILQGLFAEGAIALEAALPVLFGDNIGTTITAVLASIGTSLSARRAACVHVMFNVIGAIIFLIFLTPFTNFIRYLQTTLSLNPEMTIAFAHGSFNVTNTIIQFPFIAGLAWLVTKLVPGEETNVEVTPQYLNPALIQQSPYIALGQAKKEVQRMASFAHDALAEAILFFNTKDNRHAQRSRQYENAIDRLNKEITDYLVQISTRSLSPAASEEHHRLIDAIRDIERVGDHAQSIIDLLETREAKRVPFSDEAFNELNDMMQLTIDTFRDALTALFNNDKELAQKVVINENKIDKMERILRKRHSAVWWTRSVSGTQESFSWILSATWNRLATTPSTLPKPY